METRESIIHVADELIRERGYNAFSFYDIANNLGIKNSSIHYHFPSKTDLGVAVVKAHLERLKEFRTHSHRTNPEIVLKQFMYIYSQLKLANRVCIVGSLAPEVLTVDSALAEQLGIFVRYALDFVTELLERGREEKKFAFEGAARTQALMIQTNLLAALQLTRLTEDESDFDTIQKSIVKNIVISNEL